jgi:hypothetical protein
VGYLFMTRSGTQFRQSLVHNGSKVVPEKIEQAREFVESKGRIINDKVRSVLDRANESIAAGQQAYRDSGSGYQSSLRRMEGRSHDITSNVHKAVDDLSKTAVAVQKSFLDPVYDLVAIVKGFDRGIRRFVGRPGRVIGFESTTTTGPNRAGSQVQY